MMLRLASFVCFLLLVNTTADQKGVKCGGILSAPSGNLSSPNFPGLYPYNIHCSWLIVVPEGSSVLLTFHHFELEYHSSCAYDHVKIYNGVSGDEGNLLGTFCGNAPPPAFSSSWNVMSVIFRSDRHVAHRGFSLGYRKDMCGGVLTGLSGVISSPGYPGEYSNDADCTWLIHVSNSSAVTLLFLDFQMENNEGCHFDYVALFDGSTVSHRHLGTYCGADMPPTVVTATSQLLLVFKSDFNIGGRGFKAYYYSGECQQVLSDIGGNFSSPNFPQIYPNNINCHWSISLAPGYRIKLFFPVMDLEGRNSLTDACDYDWVAVYDGEEQEAHALMGRWCGAERPPSLISRGNKMLVVLSTDRDEAHKGFTASYLGVVPVNVSCTRSEFTILIPQQSLPQLDRESIYLGNPSCTSQLTATSYKILAQFVNCGTASQKYRNVTMLVNKLYIDFSDGERRNVQEYKVQCDAMRKAASASIVSAEERRLEQEAVRGDAAGGGGSAGRADAEPRDLSDIVFISICVLAVILMVIAIIWLVLL
ncbi:CUB domain-containing protein 2 isoform X1 [Syngnathoides biaculeatus]|uniref:CUB domain-containing protein 2 isoform X1 n=1 Tax=Syngnathoides biaculeatus TaxID=300417 RepID=UPI002ADD35F0|nr:CUB domain-containing protein 2 isoform X1 [Syngnathoides biaculeatus]XP_061694356.1 CUB domain-containing protein 2 isoform X1 [Syngnathoides biaculeatus]XP_061694358.1 CUB domain-containing protein 2 isoform X1 [Syngnathoides biaculeatus]XP_061694359.1 CUB domain-containing protein 2 isoform X1 [Syngnathoides biaculeatus]